MTSEPKFVPEEAVEICPDGAVNLRVRMIDSVGYMVKGAVGATEDGVPRMVTTPWFDYEIPMTEAAELGTQKVMQEHCSMGLVVTTDGTITDIDRADYVDAENRAIRDMQATGKPVGVIINSRYPDGQAAKSLQQEIYDTFGIDALIADCQALEESQIREILAKILYAFPMQQLQVYLPCWMDALNMDHPVKSTVYNALLAAAENIETLAQAEPILKDLKSLDHVKDFVIRKIDPAFGIVDCVFTFAEKLFYEILSSRAGMPIENDAQLLSLLSQLSETKKEYDKISDALSSARATGYGIVMPTADEMTLESPEILKKGGAFGVKLKAGAPSFHIIRVDIDTQISPMVGSEQQSQDLVSYLGAEDPETLWQSNIFGKSVYDMIRESLNAKLVRTPADVRDKFRGSLTRIVNEGATGLICLIL